MTYQPAMAEIVSCQKAEATLQTVIRLDKIPRSPIAPASLYTQEEKQEKVFDLHRLIQKKDHVLTFETYSDKASSLDSGNRYIFVSWWAPWQLEIAQDSSRLWNKKSFVRQNMVVFQGEGGQFGRKVAEGEIISEGTLIKSGWDHEHCSLCWQSISEFEGEVHEGYTDGNDRLCETCYETYIVSGLGKILGDQIK